MDWLFVVGVTLVLLAVGYGVGSSREKAHYKSIIERERRLRGLPVASTRRAPETDPPVATRLVAGNAVISVDYFKRFVAGLRMLVGGRLSTYESLVDRARREALLRMQEDAESVGASMVLNVRVETSSVSKGQGGSGSVGSVEVLAYGTAILPPERASAP